MISATKTTIKNIFSESCPFIVMLIDQITKRWAQTSISQYYSYTLFPGLVINQKWNKGIFLGLFSTHAHYIIALTFLVIMGAGIAWRFGGNQSAKIGWGIAFGAGLSNFLDRIFYGSVFDFIQCYIYKVYSPVFNLADFALCIAVVLLMMQTIKKK